MFGIGRKTRDILTIFHKPSSQSSVRVLNALKQASATSLETATEDQASDHHAQNKMQRTEFDIDVTEAPPTPDQLRTILEYTGPNRASNLVQGATSDGDAMKRLKESGEAFKRPVVVDWSNGKIVTAENETELVKMLRGSEPKNP